MALYTPSSDGKVVMRVSSLSCCRGCVGQPDAVAVVLRFDAQKLNEDA
jgi:hypothetical protein